MELRQLRYLAEIVDAGSVSRAAGRLRITQPALGMQIRKLEDELGLKLLMRHSRGVMPTEAGAVLCGRAKAILRDIDRARRDVVDHTAAPRGTVALGFTTSMGLALVPALVELMKTELPGVTLELVEGVSDTIIDAVLHDRLMLGFSTRRKHTDAIAYEPLMTEDPVLIGRADDPLASERPIRFAHAARHPLVLPRPTHKIREAAEDAARALGIALTIAYELDTVSLKKEIILTSGGYTILPYTAVHREVQEGKLFARRIFQPALSETLYLARSRRNPETRAAAAIRTLIRRVVDDAIADRRWRWHKPAEAS